MFSLWAVAFLSLMADYGCSAVDCSYISLLDHLNLTGKNDTLMNARPVWNWTTTTVVSIDVFVYGIIEVNEKAQTITCLAWSTMTWKNEFLFWNPSNFCGIYTVAVPRKMLWHPDLLIHEDVSESGATLKAPYADVSAAGYVTGTNIRRLSATCPMNLYKFPFDVQTCTFSVSSLTYEGIHLEPLSNSSFLALISYKNMVTKGEWELTNLSVVPSKDINSSTKTVILYELTLARRPMLYVMNLILPLFYFLLLDIASFFIGNARGEKLAFKVTLLLSVSVLLLILQDMLPSTMDQLPLIALYSICIFSLMTISLLEAMLVSYLLDLDGSVSKTGAASSSSSAEAQTEDGCQKESGRGADRLEVRPEKEEKLSEGPGEALAMKMLLQELKITHQEMISNYRRDQNQSQTKPGYYLRLARTIDLVFFVLYLLSNTSFLIYMFFEWNYGL